MKPSRAFDILDELAREQVSESVNLLPHIRSRLLDQEKETMKPRLNWVWAILLVLLGLSLLTGIGMALYRELIDPGMVAVRESGLGKELEMTAPAWTAVPPTITPAIPPTPTLLPDDERTQTREGVTVRVEQVLLSEQDVVIQFSVWGAEGGAHLGMPEVQFPDAEVMEYRGALFKLQQQGNTLLGTFYSSQLIRPAGGVQHTPLNLRIPLLNENGQVLTELEFQFPSVEVKPFASSFSQTYSVRFNGTELRLEHWMITPEGIALQVCSPPNEGTLHVRQATFEILDLQGTVIESSTLTQAKPSGDRCNDVFFPALNLSTNAVLRARIEAVEIGEDSVEGTWEFYANDPGSGQSSGISPRNAETIGNLTAVLQWAFADASRVAMEVQFKGWQSDYVIHNVSVQDQQGNSLGEGYAEPVGEDPSAGRYWVFFEPENRAVLSQTVIGLSVKIPVSRAPDPNPLVEFHFSFSLPVYPEITFTPHLSTTAAGIEMRLEKVAITPSFTKAWLCYQKPTHEGNSDWMITPSLQMDEYDARIRQYALLIDTDYGVRQSEDGLTLPEGNSRCVQVGIPLGHLNRSQPVFRLIVPRLELSLPEAMSDDDVRAANKLLQPEGIEVAYTLFSGSGGGGGGPVVLRKPDGMSDIQAIERFYAALGYYYVGPWVFEFTLPAP